MTLANFSAYKRRFSATCVFVVPRGDARGLDRRIHRAAVIGAIQRKLLQYFGITRDEAGTHARHIGALGQTGKHHQIFVITASQLLCGLQRPERFVFTKIDFGITLVGSDDEAVAVAHLEQGLPFRQRHHATVRVAR